MIVAEVKKVEWVVVTMSRDDAGALSAYLQAQKWPHAVPAQPFPHALYDALRNV